MGSSSSKQRERKKKKLQSNSIKTHSNPQQYQNNNSSNNNKNLNSTTIDLSNNNSINQITIQSQSNNFTLNFDLNTANNNSNQSQDKNFPFNYGNQSSISFPNSQTISSIKEQSIYKIDKDNVFLGTPILQSQPVQQQQNFPPSSQQIIQGKFIKQQDISNSNSIIQGYPVPDIRVPPDQNSENSLLKNELSQKYKQNRKENNGQQQFYKMNINEVIILNSNIEIDKQVMKCLDFEVLELKYYQTNSSCIFRCGVFDHGNLLIVAEKEGKKMYIRSHGFQENGNLVIEFVEKRLIETRYSFIAQKGIKISDILAFLSQKWDGKLFDIRKQNCILFCRDQIIKFADSQNNQNQILFSQFENSILMRLSSLQQN